MKLTVKCTRCQKAPLTLTLLTAITLFFSLFSLSYAAKALKLTQKVNGDAFYSILNTGKLRVGVSLRAPWVMRDKQGKLVGFEMDIANQLAKDMGVTPVYKQYAWKKLIPALLKGDIDIIASGMSITPQRSLKITFSNPYASSGYNLVSNLNLTKNFSSITNLNNKKITIAAIKGTLSADIARKIFPNARLVLKNTAKEAASAVLSGKVYALVAASPIPEFLTTKDPHKCDMPLSKPLLKTREAFAINKNNPELLNFLNSWIVTHDADGWIHSTHEYWFKSLRWQHQVKLQPIKSLQVKSPQN